MLNSKNQSSEENNMRLSRALTSALFGLTVLGLAVPASADQLSNIKAAG